MNKKLGKLLTIGVILVMLATVFSVFMIPTENEIYYQDVFVSKPRHLDATQGYNNYVSLSWDPPAQEAPHVTRYKIYRSLDEDNKKFHVSVLASQLTYQDENLEPGRQYYYWVTAEYGEDQETDFSNRATGWIAGTSPPTVPKNLEAYPGAGSVELVWEEPDDDGGDSIDSYEIFRGTQSGGEYQIDTINPATSYTDYDVTNGITYYYRIRAVNIAGESDLSNEVIVTPIEELSTPGAPTNLQAYVGEELIELHWDEPEDVGGSAIRFYRVHRENTFDMQKRKYTTEDNETYYVDENIVSGIDYKYKVSAVNVAGEGLESNEIEAETLTTTTVFPPNPQNLDAKSGDEKVKLSWVEPTYNEGVIVSYHIYKGSNTDNLEYYTTVTGKTEFTDTDVENDNTYYYRTKAISGNKLISNQSNLDSATPLKKEEDDGGGFWLPLLIIAIILIGGIIFYMWWMNQEEAKGPQQPSQHEWQKSPQEEGTPPPPPGSGQENQQQPPPPETQEGEINNQPQKEPEDDWSL